MKELTIEQKAQRYDKALGRAKKWYNAPNINNIPTYGNRVIEEIFPELKENKDERIRNFISNELACLRATDGKGSDRYKELTESIAWLEKQGEQKSINNQFTPEQANILDKHIDKFLEEKSTNNVEPKFKVGDIVKHRDNPHLTYILKRFTDNGDYEFHAIGKDGNEGGICLAVVKYQDDWELVEQKPADKAEPKFHKDEWIINGDYTWKIVEVKPLDYILQSQDGNIVDDTISHVDEQFHCFTIQDAKDGDVLTYNDSKNNVWVCIFKEYANERVYDYCTLDKESFWEHGNWNYLASFSYMPATKEQRDTLMKAMTDAGYTFDFEKKELKKIVVPIFNIGDTISKKHNSDIHDFGSFTITDITGGKYWYNDRIICDISEQEEWELYEPVKQTHDEWSEEDDGFLNLLLAVFTNEHPNGIFSTDNIPVFNGNYVPSNRIIAWLKSLKNKVQPKQEWKQENTGDLTDFENAMMHIGDSFFGQHAGLDPNDTNTIKEQANLLLKLVPNKEWNMYDETILKAIIDHFEYKKEFNEAEDYDIVLWLKSLKPQKQWTPSEEQIKALHDLNLTGNMSYAGQGQTLIELYNDLKKLTE